MDAQVHEAVNLREGISNINKVFGIVITTLTTLKSRSCKKLDRALDQNKAGIISTNVRVI